MGGDSPLTRARRSSRLSTQALAWPLPTDAVCSCKGIVAAPTQAKGVCRIVYGRCAGLYSWAIAVRRGLSPYHVPWLFRYRPPVIFSGRCAGCEYRHGVLRHQTAICFQTTLNCRKTPQQFAKQIALSPSLPRQKASAESFTGAVPAYPTNQRRRQLRGRGFCLYYVI
jgi:hypothetical protein